MTVCWNLSVRRKQPSSILASMWAVATRGGAFLLAVGAVLFCLAGAAALKAEEWPQWRGPHGSGITTERGVATTWNKEANQHIAWRQPLPEPGNSTPIVWQDKIFVAQPDRANKQRKILCLAQNDGALLWQQAVPYDGEEPTHDTNPFCSASPVTDGERVIVWYGSAGLYAYDMSGRELWRRDLGQQRHMWGYGSSPILVGDLCILSFGPGEREFLLAVDKVTGETRWQIDSLSDEAESEFSGPENNGNASGSNEGKSRAEILRGAWSTPIVVEAGGRKDLVVTLPRRVMGLDPDTGATRWFCKGYSPLVYASPMAQDDVVLALGGYFGASLAVRAGGDGDVTETHRLWHKPRDGSWLGTGILFDGHAYVCDMNGIAQCFDLASGESKWKQRLEASGGKGSTWSSMTMSGDGMIYLLNQSGDTFVFRPSPEKYDEVARNSLGEMTNSSVVIAQGKIVIRTHEAIWCIE